MTAAKWNCRIPMLALALHAGLSNPTCLAAEPQSREVLQLIRELDADQFAVRQAAHKRLLQIGDAALPELVRS